MADDAKELLRKRLLEKYGAAEEDSLTTDLINAARTAGQGLTLSFSDELIAGTRALLEGENPSKILKGGSDIYDRLLKEERDALATFREENPKTALALEIGGGLLTPGLGALGAARGATTVGRAVLRGAGAGGLLGALSGAGAAEGGPSERAVGAGIGAGIGIPLGAFGGGISQRLFRGGRAARATRSAREDVLEALENQGMDIEDARRILRKNPNMTIADLGSETRGLVRGVRKARGPGRVNVSSALAKRDDEARGRVSQLINSTFGSDTATATAQQIDDAQRAAARQNYSSLYDMNVEITPDLAELFNRPIIRQAWRKAKVNARNEGFEILDNNPIDAIIKSKPSAGRAVVPSTGATDRTFVNMRIMDYLKRGLDDVFEINPEMVNQTTGKVKNTDAARAANVARKALVDQLDILTDNQYAAVRNAYAGPARLQRSLDAGKKAFSDKMDPELLDQLLAKMSDSEKGAFRTGFAQALREINETGPSSRNAVEFFTRNPRRVELLRRAIPDDEQYNQFMKRLQEESAIRETTREALLGGRATPFEKRVDKSELPDEAARFVRGSTIERGKLMLNRLLSRTDKKTSDEVNEKLSQMLLADSTRADKFLEDIAKATSDKQISKIMQQFQAGSYLAPTTQTTRETSRTRVRNRQNLLLNRGEQI